MSLKKIKQQNLEWVDITRPSHRDRDYLEQECNFQDVDIDYAFASTLRSKIAPRPQYTFLVVMLPYYLDDQETIELHEIDIFMSSKQLITIHISPIAEMTELMMDLQENSIARKELFSGGTKHVMFVLFESLLDHTDIMIDTVNSRLEGLKKEIFAGTHGPEMVEATLKMRHAVMEMRKSVRGFKTIINHLQGVKGFEYFESLHDYATELWDELESNKELIEALEDANETLITHTLNNFLKTLTLFSTALLPASVTAGIFGMNARHMPFVNDQYDFWIMLGIVFASSICVFALFAWNRRMR